MSNMIFGSLDRPSWLGRLKCHASSVVYQIWISLRNNYCFFFFTVFDNIEDYCPGFKSSVIGRDILPPPELERIFGLTGGVSVPCLDS